MRTQSPNPPVDQTIPVGQTVRVPRPRRSDAAVVAQYIQDLLRAS